MKTRADGTSATLSNDSCGSNTRIPSSPRRSVTRTSLRGIFARSVKFSFRSMGQYSRFVCIDHAHDQVAPRVESLHGDLELRSRGDELERIDGGRTQSNPLGVGGDVASRGQVEVERAVFAERVAGPHAVGDLPVQRSS